MHFFCELPVLKRERVKGTAGESDVGASELHEPSLYSRFNPKGRKGGREEGREEGRKKGMPEGVGDRADQKRQSFPAIQTVKALNSSVDGWRGEEGMAPRASTGLCKNYGGSL